MGYNFFVLWNFGQDLEWVDYKNINMYVYFQCWGCFFLDGQLLKQVEYLVDFVEVEQGVYWIEYNGLCLYVCFFGWIGLLDYSLIEVIVKEQVFMLMDYGLFYIKLKGFNFEKIGNGFVMLQCGMVFVCWGNYWIIEECILEWANSIVFDFGNEMWYINLQFGFGDYIVCGNIFCYCGIGGLQVNGVCQLLVEDNFFEYIGWYDVEYGWELGVIKFYCVWGMLIR